jgi:hypothetical protein
MANKLQLGSDLENWDTREAVEHRKACKPSVERDGHELELSLPGLGSEAETSYIFLSKWNQLRNRDLRLILSPVNPIAFASMKFPGLCSPFPFRFSPWNASKM